MSSVVLRLFTGPHMGAELVLEPGEYVLGSSLDCDIIFQDSSVAPRHIRLVVEANPASIRVIPLEGEALVAGEQLAVDAALPPRTPCFVGLTCLAWASAFTGDNTTAGTAEGTENSTPSDLRVTWDEVTTALRPMMNPVASGEPAPSAAIPASGDTQPDNELPDAELPMEPVSSDGGLNNATTGNKILKLDGFTANNAVLNHLPAIAERRSGNSRIWRSFTLVLLLLALGGLVFKTHDEMNKPAQSIENIKEILGKAGFSSLEVTESNKGPLVTGRLLDDAERGRLVRLVQRMHLPVYLNVQVDADMTQALLTAFNSRELFPKVWPERDDEYIRLHISGYMKDGVVEAWALAGAKEDLPWLGPFLETGPEPSPGKLIRSILYADAVEPVLRSALDAAKLEKLQITYLPGTVEISGIFDVEARERLERVLAEVRERLGVPVVFQVRESLPRLPQSVAGKSTGMHPGLSSAAQAEASSPPAARSAPSAFRVTGVTMTPMRFITLQSGERIFEGGTLPGGYTLESISPKQLTLLRDGHTTTLPLRGSNE